MDWRSVVVIGLVLIAAWTDLRERKLYNWNTYTGMILGGVMHALPGSPINWADALAGWLACGLIMLLCYTLMSVGGGDVKLMAMLGACLGLEQGLIALLWTCTVAAIAAIAEVVWKMGAMTILRGVVVRFGQVFRAGGWVPWAPEQRQILNQRFRFGPCALIAVLLTKYWAS